MTDQAWAYIARTKEPSEEWPEAGTIVGATLGSHEGAREYVFEWLHDGLIIELVPTAWVRQHLFTAARYVGEE